MPSESVKQIAARVEVLRKRHASRDIHAAQVRAVRHGDFDQVAPDLFSDEWPRPIVANRIDVMAKHAAAALSPLPTVTCQSGTAASDRAREFADKRTKIANHYLRRSRVQAQMQSGADQFYSYGLLVTSVEPDFEEKFPDILIEDSIGFYPVWDRKGRTVEIARVFTKTPLELMAEFADSEAEMALRRKYGNGGIHAPAVEVVKYVSASRIVMYLAEDPDVVLIDRPNPVGRCTYVATRKPGLDAEIRGAFDDLIWVQLALHAMQVYTMSATAQAVNAPFAVPNDVTDIAIGAGEVVRSNEPDKIRRVDLNVPSGAWAAQEYLANELEYGAITPEALGGSIDASVVTGKGVQQLMAGYSQQIANAQEALVGHWQQVIEIAFQMDEIFWPDESKAISGHAEGTPYKLTYRPSRDINGDHTVEVQYGGMAGLDPNRSLVFLLQGLGANLFSLDYVRRNLPVNFDPGDEEKKIAVEQVRNSIIQGLSAYIQSAPQLQQAGQDPSQVFVASAQIIKRLQKGEAIEDVLLEMFPPPEPQPEQAAGEDSLATLMGGGGAEGGVSFAEMGLRPGLATEGPGTRPPMEMLFAGVNSAGQPNLQAGISRMNAARTV